MGSDATFVETFQAASKIKRLTAKFESLFFERQRYFPSCIRRQHVHCGMLCSALLCTKGNIAVHVFTIFMYSPMQCSSQMVRLVATKHCSAGLFSKHCQFMFSMGSCWGLFFCLTLFQFRG